MKVTIRFLILVAALTLLTSVLTSQGTSAAKGKGAPKIVFTKLTHDFGQLKPGQETTYDFEFENHGDAVLEIQNVRTSCGCTVANLEKRSLAPGESSSLKVKYHASRSAGKVEKRLTVHTNDPAQSELILTITAAIVTDLEISPAYVRFDNIPADKPSEMTVRFTAKNPTKFQLTELKADQPFVSCQLEKGEDAQVRLKIVVVPTEFKSTDNPGYFNAMISAKSNSENYPEIKIPVYIKFQDAITAEPARLNIYNVPEGEGAMREVILKNSKGEKFQITKVSSANAFLAAEIVRNGDVSNLVRVMIDKKTPAGLCNGVVTIFVGAKEFAVPVRARIGNVSRQ